MASVQDSFLFNLSTIDDPKSYPIFKIRNVLLDLNKDFRNDLGTLEGSKKILDYLDRNCTSGYHYIFLSDIFADFELTMSRALPFESDIAEIHNQIFPIIDNLKAKYSKLDDESRDRCIRFYGRCIDQELGPEERDSLLIRLERPPPSHLEPTERWCDYSFGDSNRPFIDRLLGLGKYGMTKHRMLYLQDHIEGFRQYLEKIVSERDFKSLKTIINSQYSRYFHVFAVDILKSFIVNVCQTAAPPESDEEEERLGKMEILINKCLRYRDSATEKVHLFYQLSRLNQN